MNSEITTYKEKPAHLSVYATDAFNMRITPERKEMLKSIALKEGISMTAVGLCALDAFFAARLQSSIEGKLLY